MNQPFTTRAWFPRALATVLLAVAAGAPPAVAQQAAGDTGIPPGAQALVTIELPRGVLADGQALPAGTYSVHLASPETTGALAVLERWVEFRREDMVMGREVASLVPDGEIGDVAKSAPPAGGNSRVEVLRGNDYVRVWINQNGTHYLIHLVVA